MRTPITDGDGDPRHGTTNGYVSLGCRCDACRAANNKKMAKSRQGWLATPLDPYDRRHGTDNGYVNYGCRCNRCRAAHAVVRKNQHSRSKLNAEQEHQ